MKKSRHRSMAMMWIIILGLFAFLIFSKRFSVNVVLSGSMEPALKTGGIVVADKGKREPDKGDVITYQLGDMNIAHRVVGKSNSGYITKGDANDSKDPILVEPEQITGTVVLCIPFLGYAVAFIQQKAVFCLLAFMFIQELILLGIHWKGEHRKGCVRKI